MINVLFSYLLGGIATGIVSTVSIGLMTRILSTDAYGKGMLFISLINILFFFCNMGMDQVFVRFFYEQKYKENLSLLLYRCLFIVFLGLVILSLFLWCFGHGILQWLKIDDPMMIPFLIIGVALFVLLRFTQLISRLKENTKAYNLANFFSPLFFLSIFITVFYIFTTGYQAIIISELLSMAFVVVGLLFLYKKNLILTFEPGAPFFEATEVKGFIKYGMPSLFSLCLTWLFTNLDKLFILKWSNYHELGIYTAAFALTGPVGLVQLTFATAWVPRMNYMLIHSPFKSKKTFFLTFEKLSFTLTCLFLITVAFKNYLALLVGPNYQDVVEIFPWLLFMPYFLALSEVVFAGVVKSKKSYWHIYFSCCAVCVNVLGCCLLIPIVGGAQGAAISVAMSFGIFFLARWHIAFRYYRFKIKKFKLITYIGFMCLFILLNERAFLKYFLLGTFAITALTLEKHWLHNDILSAVKGLRNLRLPLRPASTNV